MPTNNLESGPEAGRDIPNVVIYNANGQAPVTLVCEHASNRIPAKYQCLGLDQATVASHISWDPGAVAVARSVADQLDGRLVESNISRLIYDCNRSPDAADAMPSRSEIFNIPGNCNLTQAQRDARVRDVYDPFRALLSATVRAQPTVRVLITIHSFTPVYMGHARSVEIGILHDEDSRLADAMLESVRAHTPLKAVRNDPYGPKDGVTHTLREHGLKNGLLNVMIEIRNDLIAAPQQERDMANMLAGWLSDALGQFDIPLPERPAEAQNRKGA